MIWPWHRKRHLDVFVLLAVNRLRKELREDFMAYLDPVTTGIATLTAAVNKLIADVQTVNTELQAALAAEDPAAVAAAAASLDALTAAVTTEDNIINPPAAPTL